MGTEGDAKKPRPNDTPNVFHAIGVLKPRSRFSPVANVVAIENKAVVSHAAEATIYRVRKRRLALAGLRNPTYPAIAKAEDIYSA